MFSGIAILSSKWKTANWQEMAQIPIHEKYVRKWQNLAKLCKVIKFYVAHTGKTDKTSENNETVDSLAPCLTKSRILNFASKQIQNDSEKMTDYALKKTLKVYT